MEHHASNKEVLNTTDKIFMVKLKTPQSQHSCSNSSRQLVQPSRFLPHHISPLPQQKSHHPSTQANEVTVENRSARGKRPLMEPEKVSSTEAAAYRMGHNPTSANILGRDDCIFLSHTYPVTVTASPFKKCVCSK